MTDDLTDIRKIIIDIERKLRWMVNVMTIRIGLMWIAVVAILIWIDFFGAKK